MIFTNPELLLFRTGVGNLARGHFEKATFS